MAFVPEDIMFITFSSIEGSSVVNEFFCSDVLHVTLLMFFPITM